MALGAIQLTRSIGCVSKWPSSTPYRSAPKNTARFRATVVAAAALPSSRVASVSNAFRRSEGSVSALSLTVLASSQRITLATSAGGGPASRRVLLNAQV